MSTLEPDSRWGYPLVSFLEVIGVQLTPQQLCIINAWLEKHNKRLHEATVELERATSRAQRAFISLN